MTDYKALLKSLIRAYRKRIGDDEEIKRFSELCRKGTATYEDVYAFAKESGVVLSDTIMQRFVEPYGDEQIPGEAIDEVIPSLLKEQHLTVFAGVKTVQEIMNRKIGIGMKCVEVKPDKEEITAVATHFKEHGFNDTERVATHLAQTLVDHTVSKTERLPVNGVCRDAAKMCRTALPLIWECSSVIRDAVALLRLIPRDDERTPRL